jgi:hypothetical protein
MSHWRIIYWYRVLAIAGERLQNISLRLALWAFQKGDIFFVPHLLWRWVSGFFHTYCDAGSRVFSTLTVTRGLVFFPVSPEGSFHTVAYFDMQVDAEDLF